MGQCYNLGQYTNPTQCLSYNPCNVLTRDNVTDIEPKPVMDIHAVNLAKLMFYTIYQ